MISIVVCSKYKDGSDIHRTHVKQTCGVDCEYIAIDNSENNYSITQAYNEGLKRTNSEIVVFMYEDIYFAAPKWGIILIDKFATLDKPGIIGVAGTQCLLKDNPFWGAAAGPFVKGRVIHQKDRDDLFLTIFGNEDGDSEVVVVDGLFFAVSRSALNDLSFDEETFDNVHFYDLDICMQVNRTYKIYVTNDILVKHLSGGAFDETWQKYGKRFLEKYGSRLPASVSNVECCPEQRKPFGSVDLICQVNADTYNNIRNLGVEDPPALPGIDSGIIAVTGMHRSGTSCIAGLLSRCGIDAGNTEDMLNRNFARDDNQKGHFENRYAVRINDSLLAVAGGNWANLPTQEKIDEAGKLKGDYIEDFSARFDGGLIKDPRISLTIRSWITYSERLSGLIACLRHPIGVAESLKKRNNMSYENALTLWYEYNRRLVKECREIPFIIVDYDRLDIDCENTLHHILKFFNIDMGIPEIKERAGDFFDTKLNHSQNVDSLNITLPKPIDDLYNALKAESIQMKTKAL